MNGVDLITVRADLECLFENENPDNPNLYKSLKKLLLDAEIHSRSNSILQPWVQELGLRHQGVLLASIRGCDTAPRNDASKNLVRCLRANILIPFCGDPKKSASFIEGVPDCELVERMLQFLKNHDHYPSHYVGHLMLTAEIIGYKGPVLVDGRHIRDNWHTFYQRMCQGLHVTPETEEQMDARLGADEDTFGKAQHHTA